ncbi:MAG: hypothetical protein K5770_06135 [Lachnospiraceae bacterium]|nr:hypothetical protein [Lachnospiraceae bacterium]
MKRKIALLMVVGLLLGVWPAGVFAAENDTLQDSEAPAASEEVQTSEPADAAEEAGLSGDNIVTTRHEVTIKGEKIPYTAEAAMIDLESGGSICRMFYTAYTRDDAEDVSARPITFAFNGGPGASSFYIQFGCLGPRRPEIDETGYAVSLPAEVVDNENSILDMTDLVFIDPVGTGYSHALNEDETGDFIGYENDIRTVGDFIRLYINRHKRWGSPKYIAGESYGTTRAVGLCDYLSSRYSMYINGLMLVSSVNNYAAVFNGGGNDIPYASFVPTYAADAWYHGKLAGEYQEMELEDYLEEVRSFVEKEYVPALYLGRKLDKNKQDELAGRLAGYTGLSEDYVADSNLRIEFEDFAKELLKEDKLVIGRYDGRITGPVTAGSITDGTSDPSGFSAEIALFGSYQKYLTQELGFRTDRPFIPLSLEVNSEWSLVDYGGLISQEETVYNCMSKNPFLKIWVLCGYYDGATPFYSAEWVYNHVFVDDERENNLRFTYYPSGHMFYMEKSSFDKFRQDAEEWFK